MATVKRMPAIAAGISGGAILALMLAFRKTVSRIFGIRIPRTLRLLVLAIIALSNLKNLPFVWHIRFLRGLFYHLYLQPTPLPPSALFEPIVISTRSPIAECDYNFHKSNSTYFSDFDMGRAQLMLALLRKGLLQAGEKKSRSVGVASEAVPDQDITLSSDSTMIAKAASAPAVGSAPAPDAISAPASKPPTIILAGASCSFHKEIPPYVRYEIWTRLLCWDRKWIYVISHFVKPGYARPARWTLQPWRKVKPRPTTAETTSATIEDNSAAVKEGWEKEKERLRPTIYATAIAKYVAKRGRLTIPPEDVLRLSDMLPPQPGSAGEANGVAVGSTSDRQESGQGAGTWTWEKMEERRLRGLKFAEMFGGLDGLREEFDGGWDGAMGC